jgi:hypothetical protein
MNNDLITLSILFGQLSSSIIVILAIWIAGDLEIIKHLYIYLWFKPLVVKILLTVIVLFGSSFSMYKYFKKLTKKNKKDKNEK